jgi:hypothetical protein
LAEQSLTSNLLGIAPIQIRLAPRPASRAAAHIPPAVTDLDFLSQSSFSISSAMLKLIARLNLSRVC